MTLSRNIYHLLLLLPLVSAAQPPSSSDTADTKETQAILADVQTFADNMLKYGRDHYGQQDTPLFVNQLDIYTQEIPEPRHGMWYLPEQMRMGASPTGSNFHYDVGLLRTMEALGALTGDPKYSEAVTDNLNFILTNTAVLPVGFTVNGTRPVLPGGDHLYWDVLEDRPNGHYHEMRGSRFLWDEMYTLNPNATTHEIETFHAHILEPEKSFAINRHNPFDNWIGHARRTSVLTLPSSAGIYLQAWSFLYAKTKDPKYLEWTLGLANYLWDNRGKKTDIIPSAGERKSLNNAYDTPQSRVVYGMEPWRSYIASLLYAARELDTTDDAGKAAGAELRQQAEINIKAWKRYIMAPEGGYYNAINIDTGLPLTQKEITLYKSYGVHSTKPITHIWQPGTRWHQLFATMAFATRETNLPEMDASMQALVEQFDQPEAVQAAKRGSARDMAATLLAWTYLYEAYQDPIYLDKARPWVEAALEQFYREGFFVSGPARGMQPDCDPWSIYSNRSGSNYLAYALLRYALLREGTHPEALKALGDDVIVEL